MATRKRPTSFKDPSWPHLFLGIGGIVLFYVCVTMALLAYQRFTALETRLQVLEGREQRVENFLSHMTGGQ